MYRPATYPSMNMVKTQTARIGEVDPHIDRLSHDIPLELKRSINLVRSSFLLDARTDIRVNKIFSKVRSAKDNIAKLFKTNHRVSSVISNLGLLATPGIHQHSMRHIHSSSPLSVAFPRTVASQACALSLADSSSLRKAGSESIASFVAYRHAAEVHFEDFVFILRSVAEVLSPLPPVHHLVAPLCQHSPPTLLLDKLRTNEEVKSQKMDDEVAYMVSNKLSALDFHVPLRTSDSEAEYDAVLADEFAAFCFNSGDFLEWSDELEKEKQAKMDAHFTYVSEALSAPIPRLSAYFADSCTNSTDMDDNERVGGYSPLKTIASTSADSSPMTSIDGKESRPSPTIVRGLRRVRNYGDLRSLQLLTDWSDSCSDLSSWSLDQGLSDSAVIRTKRGTLRRSVKCNDLRTSFSSPEPKLSLSPLLTIKVSED